MKINTSECLQKCSLLLLFFQIYKALLLIPDVYVHNHVKHLMDILLNKLGFGSAIVIQVYM
jgi:hypothetical protein